MSVEWLNASEADYCIVNLQERQRKPFSGEVRQNHRSFFDTSKPLGRVVVWTLNFRSEMVATAGSRA